MSNLRYILPTVLLSLLTLNLSGQEVRKYYLSAHMLGKLELYDQKKIDIWGFIYSDSILNPNAPNQLPSPVIEFVEGDSIYLGVDNTSNLPHTIHLHGMDVGQANDGVPCTSFQIPAYGFNAYRLRAKNAGTFLYHCHFETHIHLQMGMYGAVIVRPKDIPNAVYDASTKFTKEYLWLASEIDADWHVGELRNGDQPDYSPNYFLVNGKEKWQVRADTLTRLKAKAGDTVLLRLANMGYGINKYIFPSEMNIVLVGSDGRKFENYERADTVFVYPGERYAAFANAMVGIDDSVKVEYLSNYRNKVWGQNYIPVFFEAPSVVPLNSIDQKPNFTFLLSDTAIKLYFEDQNFRQIGLFDLSGKLLLSKTSSDSEITLERKQLHAGIYIIRVEAQGRIGSVKLLVR